ncbi:hypothetical protein RJ40_08890 [Methanofollis aquaemaris]|uniref:Uncharacterized protein n=1 Tax=Methanofollis aquaemaris TaxID=126734 RepID=A0A8A3S6P8_9EURY|nr:hypothetical protein [Methanofollis aquaemaris]QSZ67613.1 hypothetical protein RJ40_08890 [Methanofollis aquaemaris]
MQLPSTPELLTVIIGLIILIAPLSAATVTISPDPVSENDPITISIRDLPDNSTFMIQIETSIPLDTDGRFSLSTNNFQMPFALDDGRIAIHAENVKTAGLSAKMGGKTVMVYGDGEDGVVDIRQNNDIPQGLIQYITLNGEGTAGADSVTTSMDLSGKKVGPENSDMTFTISGLNGGTANVKIYVDGALVLASEPTTVPTTRPTTSSSSSGSSGWDDSTVTTTTTEKKTLTISSLDRSAVLTFDEESLSGARTNDLAIMVSNRAVPENWQAAAGPYAILPSGASFNPGATLTLDLNKAGVDKTASLTILAYIDGRWKPLPSRINGSTISTEISEAGEFAIVTPVLAHTTAAAPAGTTATIVTNPTVSHTATTTTPKESPLPVGCAIGALVIALITGKRLR